VSTAEKGLEGWNPPPLRAQNRRVAFSPQSLSPSELGALRDAERQGRPFLAFKNGAGDLRLLPLGEIDNATVGRSEQNGVTLAWDPQVSRVHAQLERVGGDWTLVDDGLSRNGSFVNGERVLGRRRLLNGDTLRFGNTGVLFCAPGPASVSTAVADAAALVRLSDGERRVLVSLCRPLAVRGSVAVPASNREIAGELHLSVDGVKTHIRALFEKLDIENLPQYQKRTELARRALDTGLVTPRDLRP
jgi:DNA-binding CsgD family transcriptional regulator